MMRDALDELSALMADGRSHYVTEATRETVHRITGLSLTDGERWTAEDIWTAHEALSDAQREIDYWAKR